MTRTTVTTEPVPLTSCVPLRSWKAALVLAVSVAGPLDAQAVQGRVVELGSGLPVVGATVVATDTSGRTLNGVLTDSAGGFALTWTGPERFRLRAERIGFEPASSHWLRVTTGAPLEYLFEIDTAPIRLEAITVAADRRCRTDPASGAQTATLWEEARKALDASLLGDAGAVQRYVVRSYTRRLGPANLAVRNESVRTRRLAARNPIRSDAPEALADSGYIRSRGTAGWDYYAPDATVLLSDAFLQQHCFYVAEPPEDGLELVGLGFRPVRARTVPDIAGVMWLDGESAELRHVEFRYTRVPGDVRLDEIGGRVQFERLANGRWVVSRWHIRMPVLARDLSRQRRGTRWVVTEVLETGAELAPAGIDPAIAFQRFDLRGLAFDSTRNAPLAHARVQLMGTTYSATTDSSGSFSLRRVPAGTYGVTMAHPRIDSLRVIPPPATVSVGPGVAVVHMAIPGWATVMRQRCMEGGSSGQVLWGQVRTANGQPLKGAEVAARKIAADAVSTEDAGRMGYSVRSDRDGFFYLCDLSAGVLRIQAAVPGGSSEDLVVQVDTASSSRQDLTVRQLAGAAPPVAANSRQSIRGRLVDGASGAAIAGGLVYLEQDGVDFGQALADSAGGFVLRVPAPGSYALRAEQIGFAPVRTAPIPVGEGRSVTVEVRLGVDPVRLEPVVVTAERAERLMRVGFYDRERVSSGRFVTQEDIERRNPRTLGDLLQSLPGVAVLQTHSGARVYMRGAGGITAPSVEQICWPRTVLDGAVVHSGGTGAGPSIDELVSPGHVAGIEVYRGIAGVPAEFGGAQSGCGVVVIWTRQGD